MKKNRLYTANRWNQPAFMVDRKHHNIYDGWQDSYLERAIQDRSTNPWNYADDVDLVSQYAQQSKNGFGLSKANNPFSRMNIGSTAGNIVGAVGGVVNQLGNRFISNGYNAGGVGDGIANIGNTVGSAISTVNPLVGGIVSAASGVLGGLTNRTFGTKKNQANISAIEQNTDLAKSTGNVLAGVSDNNSLMDAAGQMTGSSGFGTTDLVKGGWAAKGKAKRMGQKYINEENAALAYQNQGLLTGAHNADNNLDNTVMGNFAAYGGMIDNDSDMGAIDYGFMSDYLTQKKRENDMKSKMSGIVPMPAFIPNSFAIGGDLQTNGADWSDGLVTIGAGGSHEENPYEGVQLGIDNEGTPNLVEEGETIWNDYVFSARIPIDDTTKEMFHIGKKREMTYADLSKKLEKEIAERVNDPISKAGFEKQMQMLEEQQERQKQEMETERARAAFEALSPEEQTALMQQRAEQEAMAQQAAMQEAATQQQPTPEELAIAQQQQQMADGSEAGMAYTPDELSQLQQNVEALGGELVKAGDIESNRFDYGGKKGSRKAKRVARKYDEQWFKNMAKSLGISDKEMEGFVYSADDPEANLVAFNNIYRDNQYNKSKDIYRKGQRQSKRNELFGDNGLYSYSDDRSKIYKARTNDTDRTGWINKDYNGATDAEGKMLGFLSQEDYDKLKPEEKEAYRRINERAGDKMYDYNGKVIRDLYNGTEDVLLDDFNADYDKGFRWEDKDAQTLQYPVDMERSNVSYMRYIPAIGGAIGLANDIFSNPDYSRPQAIIDASRELATPSQVQPHYIGNYLTYRPLDIWYQQNALNAQSRATDRALLNSSSPSRTAGLLANGYNSQLASGNLFRQAQEYNDALRQKVADFNRSTNIFNASSDMDSQKTNAMLRQQAGRVGLQGLMTGYGMMDDIDARRQASMSANLTNVLQSLGNIGEEAYDEDRLRWLERTGTLKSRTLSANGGKLKKKKRGLTI